MADDVPPKLRGQFSKTISAAQLRAAGNPTALSALSTIETRTDRIRQRAMQHYKNFEDRWTAKEIVRLYDRQLSQHAQHPAPPGAARGFSPDALGKMASHNVMARTNRRIAKINAIKTRMSNSVVRNLEPAPLKITFNEKAPEPDKPTQKWRRKP